MERPARVVAALPATLAPGGSIELSPFDLANQGRAIPMVWFYRETLDPALLLAALRETLKSYPVLCGRYGTPPNRVELNNQGVPVDIVHQETSLNEAVAHLAGQPTIFAEDAHLPFVPDKGAMDPDRGSADAPLLAIRISLFPDAAPHGSPAARRRPPEGSPVAHRCSCSSSAPDPTPDPNPKSNSNPSPNLSPKQKPITLTLTCCRASASPPARRAIGPASASPAARRANHSPAAGRAHASDMSAGDEAGGGTAIGVLVQHGVLDVDALVS